MPRSETTIIIAPIATLLIVGVIQCVPDACVVMANGEIANQMPARKNRNNTQLPGGTSRLKASPTCIMLPSYSSSAQPAGRSVDRHLPGGVRADQQQELLPAVPVTCPDRFVMFQKPAAPYRGAGNRRE